LTEKLKRNKSFRVGYGTINNDLGTIIFSLHETWAVKDDEELQHVGNPYWDPFVAHTDDESLEQKLFGVEMEMVVVMADEEFQFSVMAAATGWRRKTFGFDELVVAVKQND
jgi:hypothetical protein